MTTLANDQWQEALVQLANGGISVSNGNANGQSTMANSSPVVIASDQSKIPIKGDFTEQSGLSAGSLNADLVPSTDVSGYKTIGLQIGPGAYSGTLTFQWSNNNTDFYVLNMVGAADSTAYFTTTTGSSVGYYAPVFFRYFRVRMTTWVSGAATGTLELHTLPAAILPRSTVAQSGTWTVQPGNTQNTTPWVVKKATTTGVQAANTAANSVIKGSAGVLWSATVTTLGTAALSIFDNASTNSGTVLLTIPASAAVGTIYSWEGGQPAANGIVSAGVTNCPAVTFAYGPA